MKKLCKIDKSIFKKTPEELEEYQKIMRRHNIVKSKKGKGSFKRKAKYPQRNLEY